MLLSKFVPIFVHIIIGLDAYHIEHGNPMLQMRFEDCVPYTRRKLVHFNLGHRDSHPRKCINKSIWLAPGRYLWCTHGRCPPRLPTKLICLCIFWVRVAMAKSQGQLKWTSFLLVLGNKPIVYGIMYYPNICWFKVFALEYEMNFHEKNNFHFFS
jgi:hypothetical protein